MHVMDRSEDGPLMSTTEVTMLYRSHANQAGIRTNYILAYQSVVK